MRLVAGALALTLFASFARAEDTRTAEPTATAATPVDVTHGKIPLRVVRVMSQSHQALLFDRERETHVLAEVGSKIDGFTVEAIDDDEVTLSAEGKQIVLAAPARGGSRRHDRDRDLAATHVRSEMGARPTDTTDKGPAPDTAAMGPAPIDPYGEAAIRVVEAPGAPGAAARPTGQAVKVIEAGDGGIRVAEAPGSPGSPPVSTVSPASPPASSASPPASSASPPVTPVSPQASPASPPISSVGAPTSPVNLPARPASPAETPAADARSLDSKTPAVRVVEAPTPTLGPQANDARLPAPRPEARPEAKADAKPDAKAPAVRVADAARPPDKRTSDARAMADILSADSRPQGARPPASGAPNPATPAPRSTSTPQPASDVRTASAAPDDAVILRRSDVDGALADFARLATAVRGSFSASGLTVDAVSEGSIFQRTGLRAGDVITAVDGAPLRSLDDAANLYARASTTKSITAQLLRGGKPMMLHVAIQ